MRAGGRAAPIALVTSKVPPCPASLARTGQDDQSYVERITARGRSIWLPTRLGRLPVNQALAPVVLPLHLNWSKPRRTFRLDDRAQRTRAYEIVLREGGPDELAAYVEGALLVDRWPELVLPREIRTAWAPLIAAATDSIEHP